MAGVKKSELDPECKKAEGVARRDFLKYIGAAFSTALLPEALSACATDAGEAIPFVSAGEDALALAADLSFDVVRPQDLVALRFDLLNAAFDGARRVITRKTPMSPSYVVVTFPPQHVLEQSFEQGVPASFAAAQIAGRSRVVFQLADASPIPYSIQGLLDACAKASLRVSKNALPPEAAAVSVGSGGITGARLDNLLADDDPAAAQRVLDRAQSAPTASLASRSPFPPGQPVPPDLLETSLELPHRLILSPSAMGAFAHTSRPSNAETSRTEIFHTRLGVRAPDGSIDERTGLYRTVRALWTRDQGFDPARPGVTPASDPFLPISPHGLPTVPTSQDRDNLVHLTSSFAYPTSGTAYTPKPLSVKRLMLSPLGGYVDMRADFTDDPRLPLLGYKQRIAGGRDTYVVAVKQGYILPTGSPAFLATIEERGADPASGTVGVLRVYQTLILLRPITTYPYDDALLVTWPFVSIEHTQTTFTNVTASSGFVTKTGQGAPIVRAPVRARDRRGNAVLFDVAMYFIGADATKQSDLDLVQPCGAFSANDASLCALGANVAYAPSNLDDTTYETSAFRIALASTSAYTPKFYPSLRAIALRIPALRHIAKSDVTTTVDYHDTYAATGFRANPSELLFKITSGAVPVKFSDNTAKSGGLLAPDMAIDGISRKLGPVVGAVTKDVSGKVIPGPLDQGAFDPTQFFAMLSGLSPKLFGYVNLVDILMKVAPKDLLNDVSQLEKDALNFAPKFVTEAYNRAERLLAEVQDLERRINAMQEQAARRLAELQAIASPSAAEKAALAQVTSAVQIAQPLRDTVLAVIGDLGALDVVALTGIHADGSGDVSTGHVTILWKRVTDLLTLLGAPTSVTSVPGAVRKDVVTGLTRVQEVLGNINDVKNDIGQALTLVKQGLDLVKDFKVKLAWQPKLNTKDVIASVLKMNNPRGLTLSIELRKKPHQSQEAGADIFCGLDDFALVLGDVELDFDRIHFRQEAKKKPEVDVVFRGITFNGDLAFLNTLKSLIPFDGFSDPPHVDVDDKGVHAGFSLAVPNIALGVFSLENIKFEAKLEIPFIGDTLSFRFDFCSREHPFLVTVAMLGGGGFFSVTLTPAGIASLEASIEFGAHIAVDFVVASGSATVMAGIYAKLETDPVTHTVSVLVQGFLVVRGQLEILGLISVSVELRVELTYVHTDAGSKVSGDATLTIEIDIAFFSQSVSITCHKQFAGDNQDPTFKELMEPDTASSYFPWDDYVGAFA